MTKTLATISIAAILLSGCSLTPDYQRPSVKAPQQWSQAQTTNDTAIARDWWTQFSSAELNALMQAALQNNYDLRASVERVAQARASLKIAGADLLPSVGATANASRGSSNPAYADSSYSTDLRGALNVSYELDLFGANRAGADAARANLAATEFDKEALALVVMSDVAQGYFTLLNLRERLSVANKNLENAKEVLHIVSVRAREGMESDIELAQQETAVATSEASRAALVNQITNAENALAILVGEAPQSLNVETVGLANIAVPEIEPAQPSSLLERRPDIRSAEAGLLAANANIGVARAAYFPSISLGTGGNIAAGGFGDPTSTALSLAGSLTAPIFQGGRIEGGVEQANARQRELVENYRKVVATSFGEVEDALSAVTAARTREVALETAMQNANKAYELSRIRYDAGSIDFRTLLDNQTSRLAAEDSYSQAKLERLTAAISLYKSLGGGWQ